METIAAGRVRRCRRTWRRERSARAHGPVHHPKIQTGRSLRHRHQQRRRFGYGGVHLREGRYRESAQGGLRDEQRLADSAWFSSRLPLVRFTAGCRGRLRRVHAVGELECPVFGRVHLPQCGAQRDEAAGGGRNGIEGHGPGAGPSDREGRAGRILVRAVQVGQRGGGAARRRTCGGERQQPAGKRAAVARRHDPAAVRVFTGTRSSTRTSSARATRGRTSRHARKRGCQSSATRCRGRCGCPRA